MKALILIAAIAMAMMTVPAHAIIGYHPYIAPPVAPSKLHTITDTITVLHTCVMSAPATTPGHMTSAPHGMTQPSCG